MFAQVLLVQVCACAFGNITDTLPVLQQYDSPKSVSIVGNSNHSILNNPNNTDSWKTILDGQGAHILLEIKEQIMAEGLQLFCRAAV